MGTDTESEPPLTCTLGAGAFRDRLGWIADLNRRALLDARRDGRRLILTYRAKETDRVREMIRRESECCSFLGFDLGAGRETVTLAITAPERAADVLDAIFDPFIGRTEQADACGCASGSTCKGETNDTY